MDRTALSYLSELNRSMDTVFAMLDKLTEYPELRKDGFKVLKATLREQLGNVNTTALDALEQSEIGRRYLAYKQRKAHEEEIRDPNDCYLDVLRREEELQRQGLPSRIGILLGVRPLSREEILDRSFAASETDEPEDEEESDAASE